MIIECIALKDFVHGNLYAKRDKSFMLDDSIAGDLERAGLIRIKMLAPYSNKMMTSQAGKAPAAGQERPSPASPVAQVSPSGTLHLPKHGYERTNKTGTS